MERLNPSSYEEFREQFRLPVPDDYNFATDFLDEMARIEPEKLAMVHVDDAGNRREFDFGFFADESRRLASALAAKGLAKGDRVMLILYRRVEWWVAMLALHRLGAVAVPSPSLLTRKDIEFRINYAKIKGCIVENTVADRVEAVRSACPSLACLVQVEGSAPAGWSDYTAMCASASPEFVPPVPVGGSDPLLVFFTSGTTGMPKMVEHTHTYPLGHFTTGVYWHNLGETDLHLTLADTGWGKAVWGKFYGQWMAGAAVFTWDFRGKFDPARLLELLAEHEVTSFCAPPTVYRFLVRQDLKKYDLSALRHCTTAGELLNDSVFHAWKEATGLAIYEGYGQTETVLQLATLPFMTPKPGSIGKPAPGWEIALLDEDGKPCPPGVEGEICVRVDKGRPTGLFTGYLDEPGKTFKVMDDRFYHTGDKAWVDEDGYYWFLGRTDDLIKSSGYRIGPFEVESALVSHPAVVEAAVTGVPDAERGQAVKASLVLAPGFEPSDALTKELQNHVKSITAPYKYPRVVEYVAELPKTISGKIKRAEIRERDEGKGA
ncbi:AMP-binding protein [Desulfovibrio sp. X2]|uniref:AMP-binding protein n=1 Tax=Desulfovibrio sp. X2 TaxID=941449 RepID=UPI00054D49C8|nr:AMP-binding protein [Desulfovibrio sp. X2]